MRCIIHSGEYYWAQMPQSDALRLGFLLVDSRHATISRRRHIATDKMIEGGELSYNFYARDKDNDQRKAHIHIFKQTFYFKRIIFSPRYLLFFIYETHCRDFLY
jgi:hypothetical protein